MTAMKQRKYRKRKQTKRNTYKHCVTRKLNGKQLLWLTKLNENSDNVAVNAKAKCIQNKR